MNFKLGVKQTNHEELSEYKCVDSNNNTHYSYIMGLHLKMSKTLVHVNVCYSDSLCSEIRSFSFFFFISVSGSVGNAWGLVRI